ncbi:hypothetical protein GCM10009839_64330 [Catenulispora yoronensis]|uniref:Uncharacterized protein n=2 Tax=Catenulispora yoronensis TaxID=450799 RepID=A0ABP5GNK2_9ACTN
MNGMTSRATPVPPLIAALPRDPRGYPIPAITPRDPEGHPTFAITGTARTLICAVERRCSICGTPMPPGPVYRVIAAAETEALAAAQASGRPATNKAPSPEPPGHRECMLFAAFTCPFLARPNARRGQDAHVFGESLTRGTARGSSTDTESGDQIGGAVAGFADFEFRYSPGEQVAFLFTGLTELRPHHMGADQIPELTAVLEALGSTPWPTDGEACPPYLLDDEAAAEAHARGILEAAMARQQGGS